MPVDPALPPGLLYCVDVITPEDERCLLDRIANLPFKEFQFHGFEGKRRVVSFGWCYDFGDHKALPADPIPDFLLENSSQGSGSFWFCFAESGASPGHGICARRADWLAQGPAVFRRCYGSIPGVGVQFSAQEICR